MEAHVQRICQAGYYQLRNIAKLRRYMDQSSLETIIHAFITSRIDYCNSLLCGANQCVIRKLQMLQNAAARVLTQTRKVDHITPILKNLHWLPVQQRIVFKLLVITFKCVHNLAPRYLCELLHSYQPARNFRSSNMLFLHIPFTTSNLLTSAFSVLGPRLWNDLPFNVRCSQNLAIFKSRLKTHLFTECYP